MKKTLLILALIPLLAFAQKEYVVKEYCRVFLIKNRAEVLIGDADEYVHIKDSLGQDIKFNTFIKLLNYMSKNGWELVPFPHQPGEEDYLKYYLFSRPKQKEEGE